MLTGPIDARATIGLSETDDLHVPLQTLINANPGRTIVLEGNISVSNTVDAMANGVTLHSIGATLTPLTSGISLLNIYGEGVTVTGLTVTGTQTSTIGVAGRGAIRVWAPNVTVERCRVHGSDTCGITVTTGAVGTIITNNHITDPLEHGIYVADSTRAVVAGNVITSAGVRNQASKAAGIKVADSEMVAITGNMVTAHTGAGILIDRNCQRGISVAGGVIHGGEHGYRTVSPASNTVATGLVITGSAVAGVQLAGDRHLVSVRVSTPNVGIRVMAGARDNDITGILADAPTQCVDNGTDTRR